MTLTSAREREETGLPNQREKRGAKSKKKALLSNSQLDTVSLLEINWVRLHVSLCVGAHYTISKPKSGHAGTIDVSHKQRCCRVFCTSFFFSFLFLPASAGCPTVGYFFSGMRWMECRCIRAFFCVLDSCSVWKKTACCYICAFTAFSDKDASPVRGGGDEDWSVALLMDWLMVVIL